MRIRKFLALLTMTLISTAPARACPSIYGLADFNCDRKLTIAITGDSVAFGFGDKKNGNKGGYALRLQRQFPNADIINLGVQGLHTTQFLTSLSAAFRKGEESKLASSLFAADIVLIDLGRNDRWEFGLPSATLRKLKKARDLIKKGVTDTGRPEPYIITAVMMLPNRGSQGPWVKELDALILKSSKPSAPSDLRFDLVSKRLLSTDQIHPTSAGYDALYRALLAYLKKPTAARLLALRPDSDSDGIYDLFEASQFGTDPANPDTDGDGHLDGDEAFTLLSDPLVP
jgi:lysophospholipase L1-like esterase